MEEKKSFIKNLTEKIEWILPMNLGSFLIFCVTIYMFIILGKSLYSNYNSNKDLDQEAYNIEQLEDELRNMQNEINYYKTSSFKEKEAREKLAYKAPGEKVMSLPLDKKEDKILDPEIGEVPIKTSNLQLWWSYLIEG